MAPFRSSRVAGFLVALLLVHSVAPLFPGLKIPVANAASYTVTNNSDAGAGSLRQAITDANSNAGTDAITIDPAAVGTLTLASDLPSITEGVTIDGSSAGGSFIISASGRASCLTFTSGTSQVKGVDCTGNVTTAGIYANGASVALTVGGTGGATEDVNIYNVMGTDTPAILFSSVSSGFVYNSVIGITANNTVGIRISSSTGVQIGGTGSNQRNTISNSTGKGIDILSSSSITIQGNYIGLDTSGTSDQGNGTHGIYVETTSSNVTIGGTSSAARNIISGNNTHGIYLNGGSNTVQGNYIGTNAAGTSAVGNANYGIYIASSSNIIGGTSSGRNIISGNGADGVRIDGSTNTASSNEISCNYIGLDAAGTSALANLYGLQTLGANATNNTIGGASEGNVISGNTTVGIFIAASTGTGHSIQGNYIGLNAAGTGTVGNGQNGLEIRNSGTTVGTVNDSTAKNYISGNGVMGINVSGGTSNTIVNNVIGYLADGTTLATNSNVAVLFTSSAASNTFGGTATGAGNKVAAVSPNPCVRVQSTAGNYNNIRHNDCPVESATITNIGRLGSSNESVSAPTITTSTSSVISGTSIASGSLDLFIDGLYTQSLTADSSGNWSVTRSTSSSSYISLTVTNATNSTSGTSTRTAITADTTPPDMPILTGTIVGSTVTIDGTGGEYGASVYVDSVDSGVDVGSDGTFTVTGLTYTPYSTSYTVYLVDVSSNQGPSNVLTVTSTNPGAGTFNLPSSGGSSGGSYPDDDDDETPIDTGNSTPDTESRAGDVETPPDTPTSGTSTDVDDGDVLDGADGETDIGSDVDVDSGTDTSTDTTASSSSGSSNPSGSSSNTNGTSTNNTIKPVKQPVVKPIQKPLSPREKLTCEAVFKNKYSKKLFLTNPFKETNAIGIPKKLLELYGIQSLDSSEYDSDNDGLYNSEELLYGGRNGNGDMDQDGVSDLVEVFCNGTDPENYDSDGDFIPDDKDPEPLKYNKPKALTIPTQGNGNPNNDDDEDGLSDAFEGAIGTLPDNPDTDSDGLTDGDEVLFYGTNPGIISSSEEIPDLVVNNLLPENEVEVGRLVFIGVTKAVNKAVQSYEIDNEGGLTLLGESTADAEGKFVIYTTLALNAGEHTLVFSSGGGSLENAAYISRTYEVNATGQDTGAVSPDFAYKYCDSIYTLTRPVLSLTIANAELVYVMWHSTVLGQVLVADANGQTVHLTPPADLEEGYHEVTWYTQNQDTGVLSAGEQIQFTLGEGAFINGSNLFTVKNWFYLVLSLAILYYLHKEFRKKF